MSPLNRAGRALAAAAAVTAATTTVVGGLAATSAAAAGPMKIGCDYKVTRPAAAVWTRPGAERDFIKYKHVHDGVVSPDKCGVSVFADGNRYTRVNYAGGTAWMATNMLDAGLTNSTPPYHGALDTARANEYWSHFPVVGPPKGADYGRLVTWHRLKDGRVVMDENRVTMHYDHHRLDHLNFSVGLAGYTDVNPRIRRYYLAPNPVIQVDQFNYKRITGKAGLAPTQRVSRLQFLYSFVKHYKSPADRALRSQTGYRIFFNSAHNTIVKIQAVAIPEFYTGS